MASDGPNGSSFSPLRTICARPKNNPGEGYSPPRGGATLGSQHGPAGIAAKAGEYGHGHGQITEPISPNTVPDSVRGSGMFRLSMSQNVATRRKLTRIAW